jgi:hypothetical protein
MVHASSSYACAQDEYFKHPHKTSIDGDKRLDSGWILVGFGVGGRLTLNWLRRLIVDMPCLCLPVTAAAA